LQNCIATKYNQLLIEYGHGNMTGFIQW